MKKNKNKWFTKALAGLCAVVVLGAAAFSIMWFVPSIHDKVWDNNTTTTETTEDTNTETDAGTDA